MCRESFSCEWKYLHIPLTYMLSTCIVPVTHHRYWCCHAARDQIMNGEMEWYRNRDSVPDTD